MKLLFQQRFFSWFDSYEAMIFITKPAKHYIPLRGSFLGGIV